ncbi:MAG: nucleotidyl transferase AbiEii/AbiGii toxin family protein [Prevotellaceae bacterium]|jgi:predicted nucleotidyltransferase component of viral defense system|nr:nucleotidyl transferase AbiEii/AbiGii toxin family protein [Prevotellaceae bacterium]
MKILKLSDNEKIDIINRLKERTNILQVVIEKDVWVTAVLKALFSTSCASHLVFKGGTSLSKGWKLIERFSEDVDVAISRDFFGITNVASRNQDC